MISIGTNASALMAQAATASVQIDAETAMQRLSSGKRINAAKDDAAGVAIASRMTSHVKGLHQSIRNSMDAQALISTAEGGLQETEALLQRIRELAVQASNDTNSDADRTNLNNEAQQLLAGIDAVASGTTWAGQNLLDGTFSNKSFQVGGGSMAADQLTTSLQSSDIETLGLGLTDFVTFTDINTPIQQTDQIFVTNDLPAIFDQGSITPLENNRLVAVWLEMDENGHSTKIFGKILSSDNSYSGSIFEIHDSNGLELDQPNVTKLSNGDFIISWREAEYEIYSGQDFYQAYGKIFSSNGLQVGSGHIDLGNGPAPPNASNRDQTVHRQQYTTIQALDNGNFVFAYTSGPDDINNLAGINYSNTGNLGVYAKIYDANAQKIVNEFVVNKTLSNAQLDPNIGQLKNGKFIISWTSGGGQDGDRSGIFAQKFNALGEKEGEEFQVKTFNTDNNQSSSFAVGLSDGGFVIAWKEHKNLDGEGYSIWAKQYDKFGNIVKSDFQVNTSYESSQHHPQITQLEDGGYIIAWMSLGDHDGDSSGVLGQRFDEDANKVGSEFIINDITSARQTGPTIGSLEKNGFVVGWHSENLSDSTFELYAKVFTTQLSTTEKVSAIDFSSRENAQNALTRLDTALQTINSQRAELGSLSNRLDHIIANNTNASTNAKASLGRIQDADFAAETTKLAKSKILEQSSTAMLAQANASVYEVLTLIPD